jgi:hypothetical protein
LILGGSKQVVDKNQITKSQAGSTKNEQGPITNDES